MIELKSEALGKSIEVDRVIGHLDGDSDGPTMIFTAGIHGNEPSGVYALHQVMEDLRLKATTNSWAGICPKWKPLGTPARRTVS